MELEAANKSDMRVHGMCNLDLSVHGLIINMHALVVDLNCHAILGMDVLGDASKLPFIFDLVGGTLSGGGYETIQLHRFQAATECFAETTDSVCIPPHSEVMLWAKLKTNNGRRGPTAGVVLALQTFVQEFGLLVGRSLVRADAEDWKIPILIYNSNPCTMQPDACACNPVIVPAHTRIARVEEIQAIQHIGLAYYPNGISQVDAKILDGAVVVNMLPTIAVSLFQEYIDDTVIPYVKGQLQSVEMIDLVWDVYLDNSLKESKDMRGTGIRRIVVPSAKLPANWKGFLHVSSNKARVISSFG